MMSALLEKEQKQQEMGSDEMSHYLRQIRQIFFTAQIQMVIKIVLA